MRRLGKFVTKEELQSVRTERDCSGMYLTGGQPMGDHVAAVRRLIVTYGLSSLADTVGLDMENGEFVDTKEETNATD